jgi:hypothetical protein
MSLTDTQLKYLAGKMGFSLEDVCFKDELPTKLKSNTSYIINLENEFDEDGEPNSGTHWSCFQVNKYPSGKVEPIYFDPYGMPPPEIVKKRVEQSFGQKLPFTTKDIQSLMNNACGWYCCAFLHWINSSQFRTQELYQDVSAFLDMFDNLTKEVDFKKNEYILKHFFRSSDPNERTIVDVESISGDNTGDGIDMMSIPVDVKTIR